MGLTGVRLVGATYHPVTAKFTGAIVRVGTELVELELPASRAELARRLLGLPCVQLTTTVSHRKDILQ